MIVCGWIWDGLVLGNDGDGNVRERGVCMTALRQSAMMELEKLPEDKIEFVLQIMRGVNGRYQEDQLERKEAFARLEQLSKKGTVIDDDAELASYRTTNIRK